MLRAKREMLRGSVGGYRNLTRLGKHGLGSGRPIASETKDQAETPNCLNVLEVG